MSDRSPPPFSALRAVEAAARHRSFTSAARELRITHSAVSQSIRRLEADLGATLFERRNGAMEPSEAAMRLAQCYSSAAEALSDTLRDISGASGAQVVTLGMPVDFGRQWFAARLGRLTDAAPDLRFDVRTGETNSDALDAEILFEDRPRPGDRDLSDIELFPIGPAATVRGLRGPAEVLQAPLYADRSFDWAIWAGRFAPKTEAPPAQRLDDSAMAIEAALGGGGLYLAHVFSAEAALESGRAAALPYAVPAPTRLVLRARGGAAKAEAIGRLFMWLKLEIARSVARLRARPDM